MHRGLRPKKWKTNTKRVKEDELSGWEKRSERLTFIRLILLLLLVNCWSTVARDGDDEEEAEKEEEEENGEGEVGNDESIGWVITSDEDDDDFFFSFDFRLPTSLPNWWSDDDRSEMGGEGEEVLDWGGRGGKGVMRVSWFEKVDILQSDNAGKDIPGCPPFQPREGNRHLRSKMQVFVRFREIV